MLTRYIYVVRQERYKASYFFNEIMYGIYNFFNKKGRKKNFFFKYRGRIKKNWKYNMLKETKHINKYTHNYNQNHSYMSQSPFYNNMSCLWVWSKFKRTHYIYLFIFNICIRFYLHWPHLATVWLFPQLWRKDSGVAKWSRQRDLRASCWSFVNTYFHL